MTKTDFQKRKGAKGSSYCERCGRKVRDTWPKMDEQGNEYFLCAVCLADALEEEE